MAIAKLLRTEWEHIAAGLYSNLLQILMRDPSEVVREQTRIVIEENERRALPANLWEQQQHTARDKLGNSYRRTTHRLNKRRAEIIAFLCFGLGILIYFGTLDLSLETGSLQALAQVNATILAFAFAIPIAAAEFSPYKPYREMKSLYIDSRGMVFLFAYVAAAILPLMISDNSSYSRILISASVTLALLMFPYLLRTSQRLTPGSIIRRAEDEIIGEWSDRKPVSGSEIESLAYRTLRRRDYEVFSLICSSLINLYGKWLNLPETVARASGIERTVLRVGESAVGDEYALRIYLKSVLSICTDRSLLIEEKDIILKLLEFDILEYIARKTKDDSQEVVSIVIESIVAWAVRNEYRDGSKGSDHMYMAANLLGECPRETVSYVMRSTGGVVEGWHIFQSRNEPLLSYSPLIHPNFGYSVRRRLSELDVRTIEIRREREAQKDFHAFSISEASRDDAKELLELQKSCYLDKALAYDDFLITPLTESFEDVEREIQLKTVLKAVQKKKIVGMIRGYRSGSACRIERLCVSPSYRNQTIGRRLLNALERRFQGLEYQVAIGDKCKQVIAFFSRQGYAKYHLDRLNDALTVSYLRKRRVRIPLRKRLSAVPR